MILNLPSLALITGSIVAVAQVAQQDPLPHGLQSPPFLSQVPVLAHSYEVRAVMGIVVGPVDPVLRNHLDLADSEGVVLMSVSPGNPAERAGLRQYDILLTVDGHSIGSRTDLRKVLDSKAAGDQVRAIVRRGSRVIEADIVLAAAPASGAVSAEFLDELATQGLIDENKRDAWLAELSRLERDRAANVDEMKSREFELAARQAEMANDRDRLAAELGSLREHLGQLGYVGGKTAIEEGAAKIASLQQLLEQRGKESEAAARAARDHLAALQNALASNVERLSTAQQVLQERAEDVRAKIESELFAQAKSLEQKLGSTETEELRKEAARVADEAKRALLETRERLFGDTARTDELRVEAESLRQSLEHEAAEHLRTVDRSDSIEHRLGAIEERLARIEEMLAKLVKRDSQN